MYDVFINLCIHIKKRSLHPSHISFAMSLSLQKILVDCVYRYREGSMI
jgi:hypothetical protein